jgi:hypothetical protein
MSKYTWTLRNGTGPLSESGMTAQWQRQANGCTIVAVGLTPEATSWRQVDAGGLSVCLPLPPDPDPDAYADAYAVHLSGFASVVGALVLADLSAAPGAGLDAAIADVGPTLSVTHHGG